MKTKYLIAYFSRKGNNYVSGQIVDLPIGNTEAIAKIIQKNTDGDMFPIDTVRSYPEGYHETTEIAKKELDNEERPELSNAVSDMDSYDTVFLGYPNWWGTMPMAVFTFLESYDFSGKTIIPFCTHEGSGLGHSVENIKKLCPKAEVKNSIAINGSRANNANREVEEWIQRYKKL